jgi:hypothetical protein
MIAFARPKSELFLSCWCLGGNGLVGIWLGTFFDFGF